MMCEDIAAAVAGGALAWALLALGVGIVAGVVCSVWGW